MWEHGVPDSKLTVIERVADYIKPNGQHVTQWLCECSCEEHTLIITSANALRCGKTKSCGCLKFNSTGKVRVRDNLIGRRYGKLVVINQTEDYVRPDGRREARWICECDCGNKVKIISSSLTDGGTVSCGCYQSSEEKVKIRNKTLIKQKGSLLDVNPELAKEWHPTKNGNLTPSDVLPSSNQKVWWLCDYGHEWKASINGRTQGRGCRTCNSESQTSFPEQAILFYISKFIKSTNREIVNKQEIDVYLPDYKIGIEYDGILYHSSMQAQKREKRKNDALNNVGVRLIRIKENYNDNYVENNTIFLIPSNNYSNLQWAIIKLFNILSSIININLDPCIIDIKRDAPLIDAQYKQNKRENSVAVKYPDKILLWDYEKNKIGPEYYSFKSGKKVWWKCPICGGERYNSINSEVKNKGCPFCLGYKVLIGFNDLLTLRPDICKDWDYNKNTVLPQSIARSSSLKVWWKCHICGYEWQDTVNNRTSKGRGCSKCLSIKREQLFLCGCEHYVEYVNAFKTTKCQNNYRSYDGYPLGRWIYRQKQLYKKNKLSKNRIDKLNEIGFVWDDKVCKKKINEIVVYLEKYVSTYGNCNVPERYVCSDGYKLGQWVTQCRVRYKKGLLSKQYINLLNDIGMIWNCNNEVEKC